MPKSRSKRVRKQPPPKAKPKHSPGWVGGLLLGFIIAGVTVIIGNYANLLGDTASNPRLLYGLALIAAGFVVSTRWR